MDLLNSAKKKIPIKYYWELIVIKFFFSKSYLKSNWDLCFEVITCSPFNEWLLFLVLRAGDSGSLCGWDCLEKSGFFQHRHHHPSLITSYRSLMSGLTAMLQLDSRYLGYLGYLSYTLVTQTLNICIHTFCMLKDLLFFLRERERLIVLFRF